MEEHTIKHGVLWRFSLYFAKCLESWSLISSSGFLGKNINWVYWVSIVFLYLKNNIMRYLIFTLETEVTGSADLHEDSLPRQESMLFYNWLRVGNMTLAWPKQVFLSTLLELLENLSLGLHSQQAITTSHEGYKPATACLPQVQSNLCKREANIKGRAKRREQRKRERKRTEQYLSPREPCLKIAHLQSLSMDC